MYKLLVFCKPPDLDKRSISAKFKLKEVLTNERTCILENDDIVFSIDKKVVRVFLYNESDKMLLHNVVEYFYGKQH